MGHFVMLDLVLYHLRIWVSQKGLQAGPNRTLLETHRVGVAKHINVSLLVTHERLRRGAWERNIIQS